MGDAVVITRRFAEVAGPGDKQFPGALYQAGEFGHVQGFENEEQRTELLSQTDEIATAGIARNFPAGTKFEIQPKD